MLVDAQRKKELKADYLESRPPMGVLDFSCKATGERFLLASRHIQSDINSITFKLNSGYHPNRRLLELWQQYGQEGFVISTAEELAYKEDVEDYMEDLKALRDLLIEQDENAKLLWK